MRRSPRVSDNATIRRPRRLRQNTSQSGGRTLCVDRAIERAAHISVVDTCCIAQSTGCSFLRFGSSQMQQNAACGCIPRESLVHESPRLTGDGRPITAEKRNFLLRFSALLPTTTFRGGRSREDTFGIGKYPLIRQECSRIRKVRCPCSDGHCLSWKLMPSSSETGTPRAAPGSTHRHTASPPRKVCYSGVAHPPERKWKSGSEESAP